MTRSVACFAFLGHPITTASSRPFRTLCLRLRQAAMQLVTPTHLEQVGLRIPMACQGLARSCVFCWSQGVEYHSHMLTYCELNRINVVHREWKNWNRYFKLPAGSCFFCGFPLKVRHFCFSGDLELISVHVWIDDIPFRIQPESSSARPSH